MSIKTGLRHCTTTAPNISPMAIGRRAWDEPFEVGSDQLTVSVYFSKNPPTQASKSSGSGEPLTSSTRTSCS